MPDPVAAIRAEQRAQWQAGRRVPIQTFLDQYPALANDEDATIDLIYSEILLREELGESVAWEEYFRQFPVFAERLQRQRALHDVVKGLSASDPQATTPQPSADETRQQTAQSDTATPPFPVVPGYAIQSVLGEGSHGIVYLARQLSLGKLVALKMLRDGDLGQPEERKLLRRDAEVLAKLDHPNIVRIIDFGEFGGRLYYSMEYVKGRSLEDRLKVGPLPSREAAQLISTLARALHAVHEQQIVHRDLKPGNILLDEHDTPKVADFGLAKRLGGDTSLAASGQIVGNIAHMAPEQTGGNTSRIDSRVDLYALGVLLFESLTGRLPFAGTTWLDTLQQIRHREPPSLRPFGVDRDLETICLKCLEKDPERRYASAGTLADDLNRWQARVPILARPRRWPVRMWRRIRHKGAAALITLAVIFGSLLTWAVVSLTPSAEQIDAKRQLEALATITKELDAHKRVELIGPTGGPGYFRWRSDDALGKIANGRDSTFSIQHWEFGLLELLPNSPLNRYRFSAEVRQDTVTVWQGGVGLYFGHSEYQANGRTDQTYCNIIFNDLIDMSQYDQNLAGKGNPLVLTVHRHPATGTRDDRANVLGTRAYFTPTLDPSKVNWRRLAVEVEPDSIKTFWEGQCIATTPRATLMMSARPVFAKPEEPLVSMPNFAPGDGLGLFVSKGVASFRNVTIEPLP